MFLFGTLAASSVSAELKMPGIFSDNMVLQRDIPVPVWGWTDPGQEVTVKFKSQEKSAIADTDGKWIVRLDPLKASSEAQTMTISSSKITQSPDTSIGQSVNRQFSNILVGDVWLCSGQSNMDFRMESLSKAEDEIRSADYPQVRLFSIVNNSMPVPQKYLESGNAGWQSCSPKTAAGFSAVGYFFGRKLFQELNVPVGLINNAWGGTCIEPWTPPEGFKTAEFKSLLDSVMETRSNFEKLTPDDKKRIAGEFSRQDFVQKYMSHCLKDGKPKDDQAVEYLFLYSYRTKPACIFNGRVNPLIPYGIKGVIWYQGESNSDNMDYSEKQQALVNSWRQLWQEGDFPFYIVQLAPHRPGKDVLPSFWLQQYDAVRKLKNSGIVSTVDIGDLNDVHPKNKHDVGLRLALLALRDTYGRKEVIASGPTYKSTEIAGGKIIVRFENTGSGLTTKDSKVPDCFEIAGSDKSFRPAQAILSGGNVEVSSPEVKSPEYVSFAWSGIAEPNLRNQEGLPAFPFNTALPFFQPEQPLIVGVLRLMRQSGKPAVGVYLKSQAVVPLSGIIRLKSSAFTGDGSANYEIDPGEEKSIFIPVALKQDLPSTLEITVMISGQGKILRFIRQLKNSPVVELKEGAWSEQFKIEKLNEGDKPASSTDLSATFALSREKNALLIKVNVKDDKPGDFTRPDSPWEEDCIELFLDMYPLQAKDFNYPDQYADTTCQIAISPNRKSGEMVYCKKPLNGLKINPEIKRTPDGYEADIRIKFNEPPRGKCMGFELAVDDSDGGKRKTQTVWNCIGKNYRNRSDWRLISWE